MVLFFKCNKIIKSKPYYELLSEVINSDEEELIADFVLSVGVVSNHGNWFTAEDHNKELKVLAQSYDWLLFLTDIGIITFVDELIINPKPEYQEVKLAFDSSYRPGKKVNQFTKVKMNFTAHNCLVRYFITNKLRIEKWFNIISPAGKEISILRSEIKTLKDKKWQEILNDSR